MIYPIQDYKKMQFKIKTGSPMTRGIWNLTQRQRVLLNEQVQKQTQKKLAKSLNFSMWTSGIWVWNMAQRLCVENRMLQFSSEINTLIPLYVNVGICRAEVS